MILNKGSFCLECSEKIEQSSLENFRDGDFCENCAGNFRLHRIVPTAFLMILAFSAGFIARPTASVEKPQTLISETKKTPNAAVEKTPFEKQPNALPNAEPNAVSKRETALADVSAAQSAAPTQLLQNEAVFMCGAQTKKGTPCSRRVKKADRCFQHTGLPAILPKEQLIIKK